MLSELVPANLFLFIVVFARIGSALMLLPPFGDTFVFTRTKLVLALAISALVTPLAEPSLPALPSGPLALTIILTSEILVGLFIGGLARFLLAGLHTASMIIAYQTGLAAALVFDPSAGQQAVVIGRFFNLMALTLLFTTGLHHAMLMAVIDSYRLMPPGGLPDVGDFAGQAVAFLSASFTIALQVAAPVVVVGLLFYLAIGLVARLMPAMQVFFIALPLQVMLGFWVTMVAMSATMLWYFDYIENGIGDLLTGAPL
jgi:flagellar biosynthetic protein FliR